MAPGARRFRMRLFWFRASGSREWRAEKLPMPAGTQRMDGRGKYLIPGLMDVHIHLRGGMGKTPDERTGIRALQSYLYCGVTTVLDVGNNPDFTFALRDKERSGAIVCTRLLAVGGIVTYPGSHGGKVGGPSTIGGFVAAGNSHS